MLLTALKLLLGIVVLLLSTRGLVKLSEKLALHFKISPLVLGITLVALGTSLPELAVSGIATAKGDTGLAMGNIVGSNISNIFLVFPVSILIGKLRIGTTKTQRNSLILFGVTLLFFVYNLLSLNHLFVGIVLIGLAVFLTITEYRWAVYGRDHEDSPKINHVSHDHFSFFEILSLIFSLLAIIGGGYLTVIATEELAVFTGISTTTLGLSLTAIATSLPELLTTIFAQKEHEEKLTLGNIVGSNIYNLLFIGGIVSLISQPQPLLIAYWLIFVISAGLFFVIVKFYSGQKVPRWVGFFLLFCLLIYFYLL